MEIYYAAFLDLTSCRGQGYGTEGPISWLTIDDYADRKGFHDEQREDLFYYVQQLDAVYLDFKAKRLQSRQKPKSSPRSKK